MRILQIITGLRVGGAEAQVTSISKHLAERGHQVLIIYLTGPNQMVPEGSSVPAISAGMRVGIIGVLRGIVSVVKTIKAFKPHVVHSHMIHANLLSRFIRIVAPVPRLINTVHGVHESSSRLLRLGYSVTDSLASVTTFVSHQAEEAYILQKLVSRRRAMTLHNGIDVSRYYRAGKSRTRIRESLGIKIDHTVIIAIGRLEPEKDYPNLIEAFGLIAASRQDAILIIAGDGSLRSNLESICVLHRVEEKVHFLGTRLDVPDLLNAADVYALSSSSEGFGLAVAEAMASELPVVATDCGGVGEVVGSEGFIVKCGDSEALAAALFRALSMSGTERKALGSLARIRIERDFSLSRALDKWELVYRNDN